ncbi:Hypothetical predicted protein [Olea europaea subsp. europaea]|uniref:Uncharacterized protein n=1 Tax=Olea europaea subsp. europaea TaxID=158383 RepID=A0A8S0TCP3_OLEEU|nr:Hypothetical predicted protein [Olea europaea subsp. europaea]
MSDAKMKNEKDVSYTIHEFPIAMQIWPYEVVLELSERFGQQFYVHATLLPTEVEHDLPYIASLVSFPDSSVQFLDDLARGVVGPQFHEAASASGGHAGSTAGDGHDDESSAGAENDKTFAAMIVRYRRTTATMGLRLMRVEIAERHLQRDRCW